MLKGAVKVAPFVEHPTINFTVCEPTEFDVIASGHLKPDFIVSGKFSLQQYCLCLLNKLLELDKSRIKQFLQYQCQQMIDPFTWLNKLEKLIDLNRELIEEHNLCHRIEKTLIVIELMRGEIEAGKTMPQSRFNFDQVKRRLKEYTQPEDQLIYLCEAKTEYLQNKPKAVDPAEVPFDAKIDIEIEKIERIEELKKRNVSRTVLYKTRQAPGRKITIRGQINILVDAFYQMLHEKKANGLPYLDANATTIVELIVSNFVDKDGLPLSESTIRTMLSPNKPEKRPKNDNKIQL